MRLSELDLLRFFAAVSVLFFHYSFRGFTRDHLTTFDYTEISDVTRYGYLGVHLFFIISGFVILMSASGSTPRQFVVSRIVRLYPAFWACCTLTFIAVSLSANSQHAVSLKQFAVNLTMLQGFFNVPPVDGVYWSLTIELRFYALVLALLIVSRLRHLTWYLTLWLLVSAFLVISPVHFRGAAFLGRWLFPEYAPLFIAGAIFYLAYKERWTVIRVALLLPTFALALYNAVREGNAHTHYYGTQFSPYIICVVVSVFFVAFALIATRVRPLRTKRGYVWLGALTYPLYLLHQFIGYTLFDAEKATVDRHVLFWGVIVAMLALSWLVNRYVERRYSTSLRAFLERIFGLRRSASGGT